MNHTRHQVELRVVLMEKSLIMEENKGGRGAAAPELNLTSSTYRAPTRTSSSTSRTATARSLYFDLDVIREDQVTPREPWRRPR